MSAIILWLRDMVSWEQQNISLGSPLRTTKFTFHTLELAQIARNDNF